MANTMINVNVIMSPEIASKDIDAEQSLPVKDQVLSLNLLGI